MKKELKDKLQQRQEKYLKRCFKISVLMVFLSLPIVYDVLMATFFSVPISPLNSFEYILHKFSSISMIMLFFHMVMFLYTSEKIKKENELEQLQKPPQSDKEIFLFYKEDEI